MNVAPGRPGDPGLTILRQSVWVVVQLFLRGTCVHRIWPVAVVTKTLRLLPALQLGSWGWEATWMQWSRIPFRMLGSVCSTWRTRVFRQYLRAFYPYQIYNHHVSIVWHLLSKHILLKAYVSSTHFVKFDSWVCLPIKWRPEGAGCGERGADVGSVDLLAFGQSPGLGGCQAARGRRLAAVSWGMFSGFRGKKMKKGFELGRKHPKTYGKWGEPGEEYGRRGWSFC